MRTILICVIIASVTGCAAPSGRAPVGIPIMESYAPPLETRQLKREIPDRPAAAHDSYASVDDFYAKAPSRPVSLEAPSHMKAKVPVYVKVRIEGDLVANPTATVIGTTPVADTMGILLTGDGFTITPIAPTVQMTGSAVDTTWGWVVVPESAGKKTLTVSVIAHLTTRSGSGTRSIATVTKEVTVTVSPAYIITDFFSKNWQWLAGTLVVPLVVYGWGLNLKRRKPVKRKISER